VHVPRCEHALKFQCEGKKLNVIRKMVFVYRRVCPVLQNYKLAQTNYYKIGGTVPTKTIGYFSGHQTNGFPLKYYEKSIQTNSAQCCVLNSVYHKYKKKCFNPYTNFWGEFSHSIESHLCNATVLNTRSVSTN